MKMKTRHVRLICTVICLVGFFGYLVNSRGQQPGTLDTSFDNVLRNGIAVLYGDPLLFDSRWSSGGFSTAISTTAARNYTLEYRDTLTEGTWKALPEVTGDGKSMTLSDPGPMPRQRYYRLRVN